VELSRPIYRPMCFSPVRISNIRRKFVQSGDVGVDEVNVVGVASGWFPVRGDGHFETKSVPHSKFNTESRTSAGV